MVAKVYEKLWTDGRPDVPLEEFRELLLQEKPDDYSHTKGQDQHWSRPFFVSSAGLFFSAWCEITHTRERDDPCPPGKDLIAWVGQPL